MTRYFRVFNQRKDANHTEIVNALRKAGFSVIDLSTVGHGVPDLLVSKKWWAVLCELKTKEGHVSKRQQEWHSEWAGIPVLVLNDTEQAVNIVGKFFRRLDRATADGFRMFANGLKEGK